MVEIPKIITLGGKSKALPMHVAVSTGQVKSWAETKKKDLPEAVKRHAECIDELFNYQLKNQIRVLTVSLPDSSPEVISGLKDFFVKLCDDERVHKNQVRLFVIGQWYDLDADLSEIFKLAMERTKFYDNFFLNFCVNYDGREEVLGSVRLMNRKILAGKLKEEDLSEGVVKENLYSSYFPPPELIIETTNAYSGVLLWDAKGAVFYFSRKKWPMFDRRDFDEAISFFDENINKDE